MTFRPLLPLGPIAALLFVATAQAQQHDPTAAAELFREGREALAQKDYPRACGKLAESQRLDPRIGTLISLATCEEALGTLAASHLHWQQAADMSRGRGDDRADYCAERLAAIDKRVPRITIRVASGAPPQTTVTRDGIDVGPAALGTALPVEIGAHVVVASAPHREPRTFTIEAREGETRDLVVEPGALLPDDAPPATDTRAPAPATSIAPLAPPPSSGVRTSGYIVGGLGVVGLGIGAYFGLKAMSGADGSPGHCNGDVCDHDGAVARRDAIRASDMSTVALVIGGVLTGAGVALWIAGGPSTPARTAVRFVPALSARGGGATIVGAW